MLRVLLNRAFQGGGQVLLKLAVVDQTGELVVSRLLFDLTVHIVQHGIQSPIHHRKLGIREDYDAAPSQVHGQLLQCQGIRFMALAVNKDKGAVLVSDPRQGKPLGLLVTDLLGDRRTRL